MKNILWYLLAGTRGGETRARILHLLMHKPSNANRIAQELSLDYKTVRHHLNVLRKNSVITSVNKGGYGETYFLSDFFDKTLKADFQDIWKKFGDTFEGEFGYDSGKTK